MARSLLRFAPSPRAGTGPRRSGTLHDRLLTGLTGLTGWQLVDIVLPVSASATTIQLGFVLVGAGAAWLDAVSLEPAPARDRRCDAGGAASRR